LAIVEGRIVACHHAFPVRLKIGERRVVGLFGSDVAIHPDFRGQGLVRNLREEVFGSGEKEGFNFHFSLIQNPLVIKSLEKRQYRSLPYKIMIFVKIGDIDLFLEKNPVKKALLRKWGFYILMFFNKIQRSISGIRKLEENNDIDVLEIREFDHRINLFLDESKKHHNLMVERDKDYLNWRYCDPRGGEYYVAVAEDKERILGYMVLRIKCDEDRLKENSVGYIIDLLVLPNRLDVAEKLLDKGIQFFKDNSVNLIQSLVIKNHPFEKVFRKKGFINSRINMVAIHKSLNGKIGISDFSIYPGEIHLQYGDTDWI
jgi:ribosomal protein S18 acetylase RimI-like enzyme